MRPANCPHRAFNLIRKTNTEQMIPSMLTGDECMK